MLAYDDVRGVPCTLRSAMHRVVFRRGDRAVVASVFALHPCDKGNSHASSQERVFSVCLLPAPPARIAKDVDVRRPKIKSLKHVAVTSPDVLRVLDSSFRTDGDGHIVNTGRVESRCQADGFGKFGRSVDCDAV